LALAFPGISERFVGDGFLLFDQGQGCFALGYSCLVFGVEFSTLGSAVQGFGFKDGCGLELLNALVRRLI
jgi:hypothetical protein